MEQAQQKIFCMKCGAEMEADSYGGANCLHCGAHLDAAGILHVEVSKKEESDNNYDLYIKIGISVLFAVLVIAGLYYMEDIIAMFL